MLGYENLVTWVIVGGVSGWLAGLIVEGYGFGLLGNIAIGFLGAVVASFGVSLLDLHIQTTLGNILAVTAGAVSLLTLAGLLRRATRAGR